MSRWYVTTLPISWRNKDTLHNDVASVMQTSKDSLVQDLFPIAAPSTESTGSRRGRGGKKSSKKTLGTQFKEQLNSNEDFEFNMSSFH